MGLNDKFAILVRFEPWLFSSSGRALALPATDAAVLEARRLARRGSDKRSSRSKPDMDIPSPPADFLLGKK